MEKMLLDKRSAVQKRGASQNGRIWVTQRRGSRTAIDGGGKMSCSIVFNGMASGKRGSTGLREGVVIKDIA